MIGSYCIHRLCVFPKVVKVLFYTTVWYKIDNSDINVQEINDGMNDKIYATRIHVG